MNATGTLRPKAGKKQVRWRMALTTTQAFPPLTNANGQEAGLTVTDV